MEQQLFKMKEAAGILSVSFQWLDQKVRAGKIKSVKLGVMRAISIEEINRIKEEGVKK